MKYLWLWIIIVVGILGGGISSVGDKLKDATQKIEDIQRHLDDAKTKIDGIVRAMQEELSRRN
jgi:hypothetical protein